MPGRPMQAKRATERRSVADSCHPAPNPSPEVENSLSRWSEPRIGRSHQPGTAINRSPTAWSDSYTPPTMTGRSPDNVRSSSTPRVPKDPSAVHSGIFDHPLRFLVVVANLAEVRRS